MRGNSSPLLFFRKNNKVYYEEKEVAVMSCSVGNNNRIRLHFFFFRVIYKEFNERMVTFMDITKSVAKIRLGFHMNMCDVYNVANQLKIISDEKADTLQQRNLVDIFDCMERLGYKNVPKMKKREKGQQ